MQWLGFAKIGVEVAMINTSIVKKGLFHCIKISKCKMIFFGVKLAKSVAGVGLSEFGVPRWGPRFPRRHCGQRDCLGIN